MIARSSLLVAIAALFAGYNQHHHSCAAFTPVPTLRGDVHNDNGIQQVRFGRATGARLDALNNSNNSASAKEIQESNQDEGILGSISPPYFLAHVLFLGYAFVRSSTEPEGVSMEVLQQFLADSLNPGGNELFVSIFNLLGLYFIPIACILLPGARHQRFPAAPFLLGSMFGGYGVLGPYVFTRKPDPNPVAKEDLGFFVRNVTENKLVNWLVFAAFCSAYVQTGFVEALVSHPTDLFEGFVELFKDTAIASASTVDFVILTLSAASFIPEDLERRQWSGNKSAAALSTLLLPGVGMALYCALRPSLDEQE
mmetsp:Transcript_26561/g.59523  ORF Transcript_26561/g.59523 Transcript_26561/m.59523 type:complete len:311 (+) Transcript_26561:258-1190(+)